MSTVDPWIGQVLAGRYRIHQAIGKGGMGTVYAATQEALGRDVAVKMIRTDLGHNDEAIERFKREAQVIARLTNPNIVVIHDFGSTESGELFIVMEKIDGASLKDIAREVGGPLAWNDIYGAIVDSAAALKGAHAAGVIHRDLKPENIMVDSKSGIAKVLDFGVAKLNDHAGQQGLTGTGMIMGTPGYMAPEVVMGQVLDDPRSDLYSLGLTWLELLIGRPCFQAPTPSAILIQQINEGPPDIDVVLPQHSMPPQVKSILKAMLSRKPDDRPSSADELVQRLTALRAQIETGVLPVVPAKTGALPAPSTSPSSVSSLRPLSVPTGMDAAAAATLKDDDGQTPAVAVGIDTTQFQALSDGAATPTAIDSGATPSWTPPPEKKKGALVAIAAAAAALFLVVIGGGAGYVLFGRSLDAPSDTGQAPGDAVKTGAVAHASLPSDAPSALHPTPPPVAAATTAKAEANVKEAAGASKKGDAKSDASKSGDEDPPPPQKALEDTAKKKPTKTRARRRRAKVATAKAEPVEETEAKGPPRLTSKLIKRGIYQNLGKAKKCRNTNIKRRDAGPGLLVDHCPSYKTMSALQSLRLTVTPSGDVVDAKFKDGSANSSHIGSCVLETVKQWKFPAFDDEGTGPKEISQRVEFEPCVPIDGVCVF